MWTLLLNSLQMPWSRQLFEKGEGTNNMEHQNIRHNRNRSIAWNAPDTIVPTNFALPGYNELVRRK